MKKQIINVLEELTDIQLNLGSSGARELVADKIINEVFGDLYDSCVSCSCLTEYKVSDHIDNRRHYIEGSGQLCELCYKKIYNKEL